MFKALTPTPDAVMPSTYIRSTYIKSTPIKSTSIKSTQRLGAALLAGALLLSGCQPPSAADESSRDTVIAEEDKAAIKSDSAAARITQFQPLYVSQMQALQQRLQAEYEALQAADIAGNDNTLLHNAETETAASLTETESQATSKTDTATAPNTDADKTPTVAGDEKEEINTSTAVGERDLEVLKRISLEPQKPMLLTAAQIIERYEDALNALYEPVSTALNAQQIDTLMNINTLLPQLFEHPEIAQRVSVKSPALARLIVQHQVWQQIQAQQALDMQQMKRAQQQEFETLMSKFNDTIEDYDKQIAKYEQTLTEFQE